MRFFMEGGADDSDRRIEALLGLGTRMGFLTYQMVNELLPDEVVVPHKLDLLLMALADRGIPLLDDDDIGGEFHRQ
jgi:hypothetical protein